MHEEQPRFDFGGLSCAIDLERDLYSHTNSVLRLRLRPEA
jgi:hypothetical protein